MRVGAAGGPTIIAQVAKTLIAVLDGSVRPGRDPLPVIMGVGDRILVEMGGNQAGGDDPGATALGDRASAFAPGFKANAV